MSADRIAEAKAVLAAHEENVGKGDLEEIMSNMAPDVVILAADAPLVEGAAACRSMYTNMLAAGTWEFDHDYQGAEVSGECVFLHGVARGTLTLPDGTVEPIANNFLLRMKPGDDGRPKLWRVAFAPDGS